MTDPLFVAFYQKMNQLNELRIGTVVVFFSLLLSWLYGPPYSINRNVYSVCCRVVISWYMRIMAYFEYNNNTKNSVYFSSAEHYIDTPCVWIVCISTDQRDRIHFTRTHTHQPLQFPYRVHAVHQQIKQSWMWNEQIKIQFSIWNRCESRVREW